MLRFSLPLNSEFARIICAFVLFAMPAAAQMNTVPPSRLAILQHGVNLGRFYNGVFENDSFSCCSADDLKVIHKMGFDHLRIVILPGTMFDPSKPSAIYGASLKSLDEVVRSCVQEGLGVILTMALEEERFRGKLSSNDDFANAFSIFWKTIASHYATFDHSGDLIFFETLNEPDTDDKRWFAIQSAIAVAIRQGAKENTILATGAQGSNIFGLLSLPRLLSDGNVIYIFHYYEPYSFTHQGENWSSSYAELLKSGTVKYPFSDQSVREAASVIPDLIQRLYASHDMQLSSRSRLESDFDAVGAWKQAHGVSVLCDEFGVIRTTPDIEDRARWMKDVKDLLAKQQIGWTVWDYSSLSFGIRSATNGVNERIIAALGIKSP